MIDKLLSRVRLVMHLYTAVAICFVFVGLMTLVIVNQTISVIKVLSTEVSSVDIESLSGYHRESVITLEGRFLNETVFNISEFCTCKLETAKENRICESFTVIYEKEGDILLLTEGPRDWKNREATIFDCVHDFIPMIKYRVLAKSYGDLLRESSKDVGAEVLLGKDVFEDPSPWINPNTINQVLLSREDHYSKHKLEKSYINTIVSQATHDQPDFTEIIFSWREGQVTKIDKFNNGSYWSLATLMCTVLLAVERSIAFVNRAKNTTPQQKITKVAEAPSSSRPSSSQDPNFIAKNQQGDNTRLWSAFSRK